MQNRSFLSVYQDKKFVLPRNGFLSISQVYSSTVDCKPEYKTEVYAGDRKQEECARD